MPENSNKRESKSAADMNSSKAQWENKSCICYHCPHCLLYVVRFMDSNDLLRCWGGQEHEQLMRSRAGQDISSFKVKFKDVCSSVSLKPIQEVLLVPVSRRSEGQQHRRSLRAESHSHLIKHSYYLCFIRCLWANHYTESICQKHHINSQDYFCPDVVH